MRDISTSTAAVATGGWAGGRVGEVGWARGGAGLAHGQAGRHAHTHTRTRTQARTHARARTLNPHTTNRSHGSNSRSYFNAYGTSPAPGEDSHRVKLVARWPSMYPRVEVPAWVGGWVGPSRPPVQTHPHACARKHTATHPHHPPPQPPTLERHQHPLLHIVYQCGLAGCVHTQGAGKAVCGCGWGGGGGSKGGSAAPQQCNTHPHKPPTPPRRAPLTPHSRLCDLVIHRAVPHGHECRQYKGGLVTGGTCQLGQGQVARVCKGRRGEGVVGGRQGGAGGASGGQAGRQAAADGAQATNKQAEPHQ